MTQRSRFYDSTGGDRTYTSAAWAEVVSALMGDGVVTSGNELVVTENSPTGMSVLVGLGKAFIKGYFLEVYSAPDVLTIAAAHATLPRIDRVVVRRDLTNRLTSLAVLTGTAAASPAVPALTQVEAGVWEIPLAQIAVAALASTIVNANITDQRGTRAKGTDIDALTAATGAHAHTGIAGGGTKIEWANVNTKPTTFAPTDHTHVGVGTGGQVAWANISSKPATFAPVDHTHASAGAQAGTVSHDVLVNVSTDDHHNKSHTHDGADGSGSVTWTSVTSKPSTFAPTNHAAAHATGGGDPVTAGSIGALVSGSAGGGAAGPKVWVGTTTPSSGVTEGDIWVKA